MTKKARKRGVVPAEIKIGPINYKICRTDGIRDGNIFDGLQIYEEAKILLKDNLDENVERITLIHEILHAIFDNVSLSNTGKNHQLIGLLATTLYGLILDNPELVKYLQKK